MSRKLNIIIDIAAFAVCLLAAQPYFTGAATHEAIGLAATVTLVVHLLLHRTWVRSVASRFLSAANWMSRVNFVVDAAMAGAAVAMAATGLLMSRAVLGVFGVDAARRGFTLEVHEAAAEVFVLLVLTHLVLHRAWIAQQIRSLARAVVAPALRPVPRGVEAAAEA